MFGEFWGNLEHRHFLSQTTMTNFWAIFLKKLGYSSFSHLVTLRLSLKVSDHSLSTTSLVAFTASPLLMELSYQQTVINIFV